MLRIHYQRPPQDLKEKMKTEIITGHFFQARNEKLGTIGYDFSVITNPMVNISFRERGLKDE